MAPRSPSAAIRPPRRLGLPRPRRGAAARRPPLARCPCRRRPPRRRLRRAGRRRRTAAARRRRAVAGRSGGSAAAWSLATISASCAAASAGSRSGSGSFTGAASMPRSTTSPRSASRSGPACRDRPPPRRRRRRAQTSGSVDADVAHLDDALTATDPGPQLRTVLAVDLGQLGAAADERGRAARPDLVPDALGARRGERAQLQPTAAVGELHLLDLTARRGLELDVDAGHGRDAQRAQVEPAQRRPRAPRDTSYGPNSGPSGTSDRSLLVGELVRRSSACRACGSRSTPTGALAVPARAPAIAREDHRYLFSPSAVRAPGGTVPAAPRADSDSSSTP